MDPGEPNQRGSMAIGIRKGRNTDVNINISFDTDVTCAQPVLVHKNQCRGSGSGIRGGKNRIWDPEWKNSDPG